jgi:hypothetical protein
VPLAQRGITGRSMFDNDGNALPVVKVFDQPTKE